MKKIDLNDEVWVAETEIHLMKHQDDLTSDS